MALRGLLTYRNPDSTRDLNDTRSLLINKCIFDGGTLTPSPTTLSVNVAPFKAISNDGFVVSSDTIETLTVPAGQVSYVVCFARYGIPTSTLQMQVVSEVTWNTSSNRDYFVTFARLDIPIGATFVDPTYVEYDNSDYSDKLGKSNWRNAVSSFASLPTVGNRDGDIRVVQDTNILYVWDSSVSTWIPSGGAIELVGSVESQSVGNDIVRRASNGSGLLAGFNNSSGGSQHGSNSTQQNGVGFVVNGSVANFIGLLPMHFLVNGHLVKTPNINLTLAAQPGVGTRYDLIWLEVWRESTTDPNSITYPNDVTSGGTSTLAQLRTNLESLLEVSPTPNTGFGSIDVRDPSTGTYFVTRWAVRSTSNIASSAIQDSSSVAPSINNLDGNPYSSPAGSLDRRLWRATSTTGVDGTSWAIPLLVVKRTSTEAGPLSNIIEYRSDDDGRRYIFDICPRAESGYGIKHISDVVGSMGEATASGVTGWLSGVTEFDTSTPNNVSIPQFELRLLDSLTFSTNIASTVTLPAPPAVGSRRDLVVLEFVPHKSGQYRQSSISTALQVIRAPYLGLRTRTWSCYTRVIDVAAQYELSAAMTAAGYTSLSPGTWFRVPVGDEDDGLLPTVYATPVCLIHRRNTGVYNASSNPNGADRTALRGVPNNPAATLVLEGEILDLRHTLVDPSRVDEINRESLDRLLAGELDTFMAPDLLAGGTTIVGTRLLGFTQITDGAPVVGAHQPPTPPAGHQTVWSDSDEIQPMCWVINNASLAQNDSLGNFSWNGGGLTGQLTVTAPSGFHLAPLDRTSDGVATNDPQTPNGLVFLAHNPGSGVASSETIQYVEVTGVTSLATDAAGNMTSCRFDVNIPVTITSATARLYACVWARKPSWSDTDYPNNRAGLLAVPKKVYGATLNGSALSIGPIRRRLRVTFTPDAGGNFSFITQASVYAAYPELATSAANIRFYGVESVISDSGSPAPLRYVRLTDSAGLAPGFERIEVRVLTTHNPTSAYVDIMCSGDLINKWIEIMPDSRQVRGPYAYSYSTVSFSAGNTFGAGLPQAFHGIGGNTLQCVPFFDTSLVPQYGMALSRNAIIFPANLPQEFGYAAADIICYGTTANDYVMWTDPADLASAGFTSGVYPSAYSTGGSDFSHFGSYSACRTVGADPASNPAVVISPVRVPLLAADDLRIYYAYAPYQGVLGALPSEITRYEFLSGTVESVSDVIITSEGTGVPFLSPRHLQTSNSYSLTLPTAGDPVARLSSTFVPRIHNDFGTYDSEGQNFSRNMRRSNTDILRTDGHSGISVDQSEYRYRGCTQNIPFPNLASGQTLNLSGFFSYDSGLKGNSILTDLDSDINSIEVFSPQDILVVDQATYTLATNVPCIATNGSSSVSNLSLHISLDHASVLRNVYFSHGGTSTADTWIFELYSRNIYTGVTSLIGDMEIPSTSSFRVDSLGGIFGTTTTGLAKDDDAEIFLRIRCSNTAVQRVFSVICASTTYAAASGGTIPSSFVNRPTDASTSVNGQASTKLTRGSVLAVPNTWNSTDISNVASVFFDSNPSDPSMRARGYTANLVKSGTTAFIGYDVYGYVPMSGAFNKNSQYRTYLPSLNLITKDLPTSYTVGTSSLKTPGHRNPRSTLGACSFVSYILTNSSGRLVLGVSTGSVNPAILAVPCGSAVDGFYPVGYPVVRNPRS